MLQTEDILKQHKLLKHVVDLIAQGYIRTTIGKGLRAAYAELEAGTSIRKLYWKDLVRREGEECIQGKNGGEREIRTLGTVASTHP